MIDKNKAFLNDVFIYIKKVTLDIMGLFILVSD